MSRKVAPASSEPRIRKMTTECRDAGVTFGICSRRTDAVAKKIAPNGCRTTTSPGGSSDGGSTSRTRPSSRISRRKVTSRDDWRITNSKTERLTPTNTANCNGMISVSTNVIDMTVSGTLPVSATVRTLAGLIVPTPTTMSSPATDGMAISSTSDAKASSTTAMTSPAKNSAVRLRAPASLTMALADIEPPTGVPWNKPARMFPAPCPTKSCELLGRLPSLFGNPADTPAPCTRPTNASDKAGISRYGTSEMMGSWMNGSELGTSAMSRTSTMSRSAL